MNSGVKANFGHIHLVTCGSYKGQDIHLVESIFQSKSVHIFFVVKLVIFFIVWIHV